MNILPYKCTTCVSGAQENQKRASDPLELELYMAASPVWYWEWSLGPWQEQRVLVTDEQFLQPCFLRTGLSLP